MNVSFFYSPCITVLLSPNFIRPHKGIAIYYAALAHPDSCNKRITETEVQNGFEHMHCFDMV